MAYGVTPLLSRGIDGSGEIVVMPELAQTPASNGGSTDIRQDLAAFDSKFGLPPAKLQVVNTITQSKTPMSLLPKASSGFSSPLIRWSSAKSPFT